MAAIENRIVIGNDLNNPIFDFDNDTIMSINSDTSVSLVGEELYIDQFATNVDYYVWQPYVINPADDPGAEYGPFSGDVVTFEADKAGAVTEGEISIEAEQDLNGYDKPWGPGAGTNKFDKDHSINSTHTSSISTALSTYISTGQYATGYTTNATSLSNNSQYCTTFTPCASGTIYTTKNLTRGSNLASINFIDDSGTVVSHNSSWSNQAWTHTATATEKYIMVCAKVAELGNVMIVEGNTMPSMWSPYSNICPISGFSAANIVVSPTLDAQDGTTYTVPFDATAYAGTLDVTSGVLKKRPSYASYNGEALVGPWISSMDAYAVGTTPTTGAQVVDLGGAETTVTLTPQTVQTLAGVNNIWSDTGSISGLKVVEASGYDAFVSSDGYILCSRKNYDIRLLPYGTKITYYMAGVIAGVFYAKTVERVAKEFYKISAVSAIGLMDKQPHKGGIYTGQYLQDVIEDIVGTDFDYIIDGAVAVQTVYGWLPYATRRENLYQLMLAYGFEILVGDNGAMFFTFPDDDQTYNIPPSRVYSGGKVIYDEPASRVEVVEHSYHYDPAVLDVVLFDNSSDASVTDVLIKFDQPIYPSSIYCASGSLTISETYANYAIVSGVGVLKGKPYAHNERLNVQENENATVEKVVSVQNATAVSFVNADNVLARLSEFYFNAQRIEQGILVESEKPGQIYATQNAFGEVATGFLTKMQKTISAVAKANCRFIQNYTPVGAGAAYTNRVVIPLGSGASQTWAIPSYVFEKETPAIRVTLIGKGANGEAGEDGQDGGESVDKAGNGGAGGLGGAGGQGGNIFTVSILATGLTEITLANSGDDSTLSSTYYNYSSADGAPSAFGYFDILTQEVFAHPGKAGVPGGAGGKGDYYTHSRAAEATMTDGEDVVYNGVTYHGGEKTARNITSGSAAFPNSSYSGNLTLYSGGGGGGGAAVGNDGGDSFKPNGNPSGYWWNYNSGGNGANAVDADAPGSGYGNGGNGGHGGGGGGAPGNYESWNHVYSSVIATGSHYVGKGGKGSYGSNGNYGCAIIYY